MTPTRMAMLVAYVRVDATNKAVAGRWNGVSSTKTLTEGVYPFGINGHTAPTDTTLFGATSFLEMWSTVTGMQARLYHGASPAGITATTTYVYGANGGAGHVALDPQNSGDFVSWGSASTTMDPTWFGRPRSSTGSWSTWPAGGTVPEDGSLMCCSPVFVGDVQIRGDRAIERVHQTQTQAENRKIRTMLYGEGHSRYLEARLTGVPRAAVDNSYHAMRRFLRELRTGQSFAYIPDVQVFDGETWKPDRISAGEAGTYGWQRMCLSPQNGTVEWDDPELVPGYANLWAKGFYADEYVA